MLKEMFKWFCISATCLFLAFLLALFLGFRALEAATVVPVFQGGTGTSSIPAGWVVVGSSASQIQASSSLYLSPSGKIGVASTSPTFQLSVKGNFFSDYASTSALSVLGPVYITGALDLASALPVAEGGTNAVSFSPRSLLVYDGTRLSATSSNPLYVGSFIATSTTLHSGLGTSTPFGYFSINPNGITGPAFVVGSSTQTIFSLENDGFLAVGTTTRSLEDSTNPSMVIGGEGNVTLDISSNVCGALRFLSHGDSIAYISARGAPCGPGDGSIRFYTALGAGVLAVNQTWQQGGNVGFGTTTPWKRVSIDGTGAWAGLPTPPSSARAVCLNATTNELYKNTTTSCTVSSRENKENIEVLGDVSSLMSQFEVVTYTEIYDPEHFKRYGLIAEDVFEYAPELVGLNDQDKPASINYEEIIPILIKSAQNEREKVADLELRVSILEAKIEALK